MPKTNGIVSGNRNFSFHTGLFYNKFIKTFNSFEILSFGQFKKRGIGT